MLVTGFGPFRNIVHNPSALLAEQLSDQFQILPVTYPAAETFAKSLRSVDADVILCLGLNARLDEPAFELYAHNHIGSEPGSSGRKHTRTVIRKSGPKTLGQTLASPEQLLTLPMKTSFTPGDYLCNFLLYSLLVRYPERRNGFVHIPLFERMSEKEQMQRIKSLLSYCN
jgi:pyrrolidone-carboxylate peptidase